MSRGEERGARTPPRLRNSAAACLGLTVVTTLATLLNGERSRERPFDHRELRMWSDRETTEDCLGFAQNVASLAEVCLEKALAPLTLGVFGSWGSGKTSLMRMLERRITEMRGPPQVLTVWFNAWQYAGKEEIQSALIQATLQRIREEETLVEKAKDAFEKLRSRAGVIKLGRVLAKSVLTMSPDIDGLLKSFETEGERLSQSIAHFEADLADMLRRMEVEHLVIFIDDLDRCGNERVIEAFETIKLFLNVPACTFVVGADAGRIEAAVHEAYAAHEVTPTGRSVAEDYLEKIVQIPFQIPEQNKREIACYIGMLTLSTHLKSDGWNALLADREHLVTTDPHESLKDWATKHGDLFESGPEGALRELEETQPHVGILARGLRGNPRQLKRFLNIVQLRKRLADANGLSIEQGVLLKLLVLEYTWRDFFQAVVDTVDVESGNCELLAEIASRKDEDPESVGSETLGTALQTPGLPEFLLATPRLEKVDLSPYLFLAQTALGAQAPLGLAPPDEAAIELAEGIETGDRIRSKAAARRAAATEPAVVAAVVRRLLPKLIAGSDKTSQVNIGIALAEICDKHPSHYEATCGALDQIDPKSNEGLVVATGGLLAAAEKAGVAKARTVRDKFRDASNIARALDKGTSRRRGR